MRNRCRPAARFVIFWIALALALPPAVHAGAAAAPSGNLPAALLATCNPMSGGDVAADDGADGSGACHACPATCHGGALAVLAASAEPAIWPSAVAVPIEGVAAAAAPSDPASQRAPPAA